MTHLFFPRTKYNYGYVEDTRAEAGKWERIRKAKAVCRSCVVISECRAWVLEFEFYEGVQSGLFAGLTESDRKKLIRAERKRRLIYTEEDDHGDDERDPEGVDLQPGALRRESEDW